MVTPATMVAAKILVTATILGTATILVTATTVVDKTMVSTTMLTNSKWGGQTKPNEFFNRSRGLHLLFTQILFSLLVFVFLRFISAHYVCNCVFMYIVILGVVCFYETIVPCLFVIFFFLRIIQVPFTKNIYMPCYYYYYFYKFLIFYLIVKKMF